MSNFWCPEVRFSVMDKLSPILEDCGALPEVTHCEILNVEEVMGTRFRGGQGRDKPFPVTQLKLTLETFDADHFEWNGKAFVSEKMRDVMNLDPSSVRFFEVDASQSAPLPRSKNYQVMEVAATEEVIDQENSEYQMRTYQPGIIRPWRDVRHFAFRPDAAPKHDLFYDNFESTMLLCTEAFALRVLKAGCTGMSFSNPNNQPRSLRRVLYRTLRGIEEYMGWDPVNRVEIMEMFEPIN
jgi:hypothetical protein